MEPHILRRYTEWGINLKSKAPKFTKKLWINIFLNVGVIFIFFLAVLTVANSALLTSFFGYKQRNELVREIERVAELELSESTQVLSVLREISDKNLEVEIYDTQGRILYTTQGSQLMDYFEFGSSSFSMSHDRFLPTYTKVLKNGIIYEEAVRSFDKSEFLICRKKLDSKTVAEVRVSRKLIVNSAQIAGEFTIIVGCICFAFSLVWICFFARKFSKPLTTMNEITRDMAQLKFERKLNIDRNDEIGQLANSINVMSDSLSTALEDLKQTNAQLRGEIELERSLDKMRREFVADVSHELKTPISIISGYAEGLKLNINAKSREEYCDIIIDESVRMNRLVLSILELSKYQSNQIPINPEVFDVSQMASELATRIVSSDKKLSIDMPMPDLVFADSMQIEQVLKSFLENAESHTESGGEITVSSKISSENIRISVANTGRGIPEEIMPDIWQSFYRGDSSHKRSENRFGLGLSIVSAIMKMHGKDCGVYNTQDGVCFWFDVLKADEVEE